MAINTKQVHLNEQVEQSSKKLLCAMDLWHTLLRLLRKVCQTTNR